MHPVRAFIPCHDRPIADLRATAIARRFRAPPATTKLLAEFAFGTRDGMSATIRIVPAGTEARS